MIIDFHSHILPGADHGSRCSSEAEEQLATITDSGVELIVATPHFYPNSDNVESFIERVDASIERIRKFRDRYPNIQICIGAEVLTFETIANMPEFDRLCIRGTKCILLEMPFLGTWSESLLGGVENIIESGFTVVLAHIDRYISHHEREIDRLLAAGAVAQINADGFKPFFLRKKLMSYVESDKVYAIGSDLHGTDKKGYKAFCKIKNKIGSENYKRIMEHSAALLCDAERI